MPSRFMPRRARGRPFVVLATLAALGCGDAPTAPSDGRLLVPVAGLPAYVPAAVSVTGPDGYTASIPEPRLLTALRHGTYTIVAGDVTTPEARFTPAPATQTVSVGAGITAGASAIVYAVATARLAVDVTGLPGGAAAAIVVTGPGNFSRTVSLSDTIELLAPGTYAVAAGDVSSGGRTYRAESPARSIELSASTAPARLEIAYGPGSATLDVAIAGLPDGVAADVLVTGPLGYARTVRGSTTLRNLDPGTYDVTPRIVGSELTTYRGAGAQAVVLGDGGSGTASVSYSGAPLALGIDLVVEGLQAPVFLSAPAGDSRLFVVERPGRVRLVKAGALEPTPFLDITGRVNFIGERGMLGMAFDPLYAETGRFFVFYVNLRGDVVVERFASVPGTDVAGQSLGIVIEIPHRGNEHHGGMIAFGPDGMLYLGPGDGRCCGDPDNNAQNRVSLLGKLLRIDVRTMPYTIPATNPFVDGGGAPEVWAYGLRNPWRFSFDDETRRVYVGDVGQDAREEINVASSDAAGLNYGWRLMEGTACYLPATACSQGLSLTLPVHEYLHPEGCSVTGGYVYRGRAIPELGGHYLYGDYCRGWVRSFRSIGSGATDHRSWAGISASQLVSFGRDGFGELYLVAGTRVWRLVRR